MSEKKQEKRKLETNRDGKSVSAGSPKLRIENKDHESIPIGKEPPRLKQQSYKDITAKSVVKLPYNQVKPVNQRIFCIAIDPGEMKTEAGIILPTTYTSIEAKGNQKRNLLRYFVIDVADDCDIRFEKTKNTKLSKIERGDEVFPFIPVEAVDFRFPTIHDFYNHEDYIVLHQTELGGVGISSLLKKEKDIEEGPMGNDGGHGSSSGMRKQKE